MSGQGSAHYAGFNPLTFIVGIWFYWPFGLLLDAFGMTSQFPEGEDGSSRSPQMLAYRKVKTWRNGAVFLAVLAAVISLTAMPILALPSATVAAVALARRYHLDAYGEGWQFLTRWLDAAPFTLSALASLAGVGVAVNLFPDPKVGMGAAGILGGIGLIWLLVLAFKVPRDIAAERQAEEAQSEQEYMEENVMLDSMLGVRAGTFMEARANNEAGVVVQNGRWTLTPLPRAATDLIIMKGEAVLRDRAAAIRPDLHAEIVEPNYVLFVPASDEVLKEREHLKATGGLAAGSEVLDEMHVGGSQPGVSWDDLQ